MTQRCSSAAASWRASATARRDARPGSVAAKRRETPEFMAADARRRAALAGCERFGPRVGEDEASKRVPRRDSHYGTLLEPAEPSRDRGKGQGVAQCLLARGMMPN